MMQLARKRNYAAGEQRHTHIHSTHLSVWFGLVSWCNAYRCRWFCDAMHRGEKFMRLVNKFTLLSVQFGLVWWCNAYRCTDAQVWWCNAQTREIYAACEQSYTHIHTAPFRLWFHLMEHRSSGGGAFLSRVVKFRWPRSTRSTLIYCFW